MTANPKPSTEPQRRAEIKRRRENSTFWTAVHLFGSLNLAVILISTIAGAIAFATIMESKFDSKVAAYYIYNAAWFSFWLVALALNLICSALTRWPWQRKHLGFVVTHAGIILLLTGAVIGKTMGFEAFVTLDKTKPPEGRLFMRDNILTVDTAAGERWQMPFDTDMHPPTTQHPFALPLVNTKLTLVVDKTSETLVPDDLLVASKSPDAPAGVGLHFVNAGMNQNVAVNLVANDEAKQFDFFGLAKIELVDALPEDQPIAPAPEAPAASAAPRDETPFRETQVVFANNAQPPVIDTDSDLPSGYTVTLAPVTGKPGDLAVTVCALNGTMKTWPLHALEGKWSNLNGDGDLILFRVAKYWPEFTVKNGVPASLSDQPRNPAVLVQITGPSRLLPPPAPKPATAAPPLPQGLVMRVALAKEPGRIVYELERAGKIVGRATAAEGETFRPGWSKWETHVDLATTHAELHRNMTEYTGKVTPMMAGSFRPGIHAHLIGPDGASGSAEWIPGGASMELFTGNDFARIGFGQRTIPLSFLITLEDFQVPRDEGTETPSNFISTVRFDEASTGKSVRGTASMNSPAMFPGDFWRSLLGWNYKFSQANWNPRI